jgi:hypothetical protein
MTPLQKEIADYMRATLLRIAAPWKAAVELKSWFYSQREKDMRASLVIVGSSPEHRTLYNAFLARGNALATASHFRDAAE